MNATPRKPMQFSLRTLLRTTMWAAFLIAIYLQDKHAMTKHRERMEKLKNAGVLTRASQQGAHPLSYRVPPPLPASHAP
jgi:hypothetical protein